MSVPVKGQRAVIGVKDLQGGGFVHQQRHRVRDKRETVLIELPAQRLNFLLRLRNLQLILLGMLHSYRSAATAYSITLPTLADNLLAAGCALSPPSGGKPYSFLAHRLRARNP